MKSVVIMQKYLTPYRVPAFNGIAEHPGIDVSVVYYGTVEERRKATVFPERRFREIQSKTAGFKGGYESNVDFPLSLYRDLRELRPDVIICAPDLGGLIASLYARMHNGKVIIWSEATDATEARVGAVKTWLRERIYRCAWRFVVPGANAEQYIRRFRQDAPFYYSNNAVEEERYRVTEQDVLRKFSNGILRVTFSGSLIERKGIRPLLEGFDKLMSEKEHLRDTCELRILGTGPYDIAGYKRANVHFEGFCEGSRYTDILKSSHIFLLPSLYDCNPLTVIEALYAGNVLLVSEGVGNHPEAVNGNGIVMKTNSAKEMAESLGNLLDQPRACLAGMAVKSLHIAESFSTRRSANGFISAVLTGQT